MGSRGGRNFGRPATHLSFSVPGGVDIGPILQPPPAFLPREKRYEEIPETDDMEYLLVIDRTIKDQLSEISQQSSIDPEQTYQWKCLPQELKPKVRTKMIRIKNSIVNGEAELNRLEQLEKNMEKTGEDVAPDDDIDDVDDEMDEGTDYANNYFDNGENYEEMDDAEAGPVY